MHFKYVPPRKGSDDRCFFMMQYIRLMYRDFFYGPVFLECE